MEPMRRIAAGAIGPMLSPAERSSFKLCRARHLVDGVALRSDLAIPEVHLVTQ